MRTTVLAISALITTLIAAGAVYQAYILLWRPELSAIPQYEIRKWPRWKRAALYGSTAVAFVGVGFMIYKGVEGALWFIPKSWRHITEDGESEWIAHGVAMLIAFYGSFLVCGKLSELAEEKGARILGSAALER